ncbi:hypothetical protein F5883DRAFT_651751 [Diaporthe sp. PMI_573]|nr:hypothetical protein F5883DRAFT_651751 [Diaporthaceae sp. PMI_573]
MKGPSVVLFLAFVASTLAAPSTNEQTVTLGISSIKSSSNTYMTVRDKATSELLATSESTTLDIEDFSISADVDQSTGAGSLVIGDKTFLIHEDPTVSGGIKCARLYNNQEFFVSCDINVPVSSKIRARSARAPVAHNTAHTAYTIQNGIHNPCTRTQNSRGPYVMFSPNHNQGTTGGGYYYVIGTCRNQGDNYWDYNGRAGGP